LFSSTFNSSLTSEGIGDEDIRGRQDAYEGFTAVEVPF
jgi:hypothetical protein